MKRLLERFDEGVQKVVDAGMFFVMRKTGLTKSFIRYAIGAFTCVCFGALGVTHYSVFGKVWIIVLYGLGSVLNVFCANLTRRRDESAEQKGMYLAGPTHPLRWFWWMCLLVDLTFRDRFFSEQYRKVATFVFVLNVLWDISNLLLCYTWRTPPRPPPERETERTPVLVPARSQS
jgi:hypothetical protein